MHDQTRKTITLLLFFLLVPVLTCVIIGGAVVRKLPENTRAIERNLSLQTGLDWNIESSEYCSPNRIRLKNVSLKNIINSEPVYSAPVIDITFLREKPDSKFFIAIAYDETNIGKDSLLNTVLRILSIDKYFKRTSGYCRVSVPKSEVHIDIADAANSSAAINSILSQLIGRFAELSEVPAQLFFDEINVKQKADSGALAVLQFRFVSANIYRTETAYRSEWSFQIPAVSEMERQQIEIEHHRNHQGFDITFRTQYQPVPCRWVSMFCPYFAILGDNCLFSGEISVNQRGGQQTVQLHNAFFNNLDMVSLTADYAPSALKGVMDVSIEQGTLAAGVMLAKGWLHAKDGTIERALFHRLVDRFALQVQPPEILDSVLDAVPYDACNINFQMTSEGIIFWSSQTKNVFMTRMGDGFNSQPMYAYFTQNNMQPVSYHSLLSLFAPDAAPIVPLTPGIQRIVSFLPSGELSLPTRNIELSLPARNPALETPQPIIANPWQPKE